MERLGKVLGLLLVLERNFLGELKDWEFKGICLIFIESFLVLISVI